MAARQDGTKSDRTVRVVKTRRRKAAMIVPRGLGAPAVAEP